MWGRGWGWRRMMAAQMYGDPQRAYFGLGPCGEYMYQMYKSGGQVTGPVTTQNELLREIQELRAKIEELERKLRKG